MRLFNFFKKHSRSQGAIIEIDSPYDTVTSKAAAMNIATASRCIQLISETVACVPIVRQRKGAAGQWEAYGGERLLNVQPNADMSAFDFWAATVSGLVCNGNAYILPIYDEYGLAALIPLTAQEVNYDYRNGLYNVISTKYGAYNGWYDRSDIIHLRNRTREGLIGVGVLASAAETLQIVSAGEKETKTRFKTGGKIAGMLSNVAGLTGLGNYDSEELDKVAKKIADSLDKGTRIVTTPTDSKFTPFAFSSADLEFLSTRKFEVREICRFFSVPPTLVYDEGSTNYRTGENANIDFFDHTIIPILTRIEQELTRKLVPSHRWGSERLTFDLDAMSRRPTASGIAYVTSRINIGLDTPNEARIAAGKAPVDGGDVLLLSANLKDIKTFSDEHKENI